jgi:hypothetical protein
MSGSQTFPKLTAEALEEHRQIHFHVNLLSRSLESLGVSEVDADRMLDVAARIESLRERLEEHFKSEEDAGLYQGILDALPQAEPDVMRLMGEHEKVLLDLEGARTIARRRDPEEAPLLRSELERAIATLRDHEREEEALVQRALSRP